MASRQFSAALASANKDPKNLDKLIKSNDYLGEGTYAATVQAVDTTNIDKDVIKFTFVTADGSTFNENAFLLNPEKSALSYGLIKILAGLLPDTAAMGKLLSAAETNDRAWEMLTGMKFQFTLQFGKGFRVAKVDGGYRAYDYIKGVKLEEPVTDVCPTIDVTKKSAVALGYKQAYLKIYGTEATDDSKANIAALDHAIAVAGQPKMNVGRTV